MFIYWALFDCISNTPDYVHRVRDTTVCAFSVWSAVVQRQPIPNLGHNIEIGEVAMVITEVGSALKHLYVLSLLLLQPILLTLEAIFRI